MSRLHPDEFIATRDQVAALVSDLAPELAGLPLVRFWRQGTDHVLWALGNDWLVRLPRRPGVEIELERRARWLPTLTDTIPVPVSAPTRLGEPGHGFPWRWSIERRLSGRVPKPERLRDAVALAVDLADVVAGMRSARVPPDAPLRGYRGRALSEHAAATRRALDLISAGHIALDHDLERIRRACAEMFALPALRLPVTWLHGDLWAGNLLVDEMGHASAMLDFAPAVGLPVVDLLPAWTVLPAAGRAAFRERLDVGPLEWAHGRGWALAIALVQLPYYDGRHHELATSARRTIAAALEA